MKKGVQSPRNDATKAWYEKMNAFDPVEGRRYGWILDYAKFRFEWVFDKTRYVEEKGQGLLKLIVTLSAGAWALLSFLRSTGKPLEPACEILGLAGLAFLLASGYCALKISTPADHVYPRGEDRAIDYANCFAEQEGAMGRFSLLLGDSTEQEMFVTSEKVRWLTRGLRLAYLAACFFTLGLFVQAGSENGMVRRSSGRSISFVGAGGSGCGRSGTPG